MKKILWLFAAAILVMFTGCASVPMAPLNLDTKAKEFSPVPNKASLYIYRNETFGAAIPMTVSVNGKILGQTAAHTYFHLDLIPGKYTIASHTENVSTLTLSTETEKNYFVWQEVKMGMWAARSHLQQVDEDTGSEGVKKSKLIASPISEDELKPLDRPKETPPSTPAPTEKSVEQRLRELEKLRKDGLITEDEFREKRQQLLKEL